MNMIPIKSWSGDKDDKELHRLIPYLEKLVQAVSSFSCLLLCGI